MAHLFVIAGHGAGDSGAVGYGYTEAERVRALAGRLAALGGNNVTVGDTKRNWYADKGISSLSIPKNWQIIELHMDGASPSARGGHVIIQIHMILLLHNLSEDSRLEELIQLLEEVIWPT